MSLGGEDEVEGTIPAESGEMPPLSPLERRDFDYSALEELLAHLDGVVGQPRQALRSPDLAGARRATSPAVDLPNSGSEKKLFCRSASGDAGLSSAQSSQASMKRDDWPPIKPRDGWHGQKQQWRKD
jgi:hypothetical protein